MTMTKTNQMQLIEDEIALAVSADNRGDAANRNAIVSRIRGDFDLPRKTIETMLAKAGLVSGRFAKSR